MITRTVEKPPSGSAVSSAASPGWIIDAEGLSKIYRMGTAEVHALRGVSLQVARGEFIALMGASGSGKTSLLQVLGCLDRPTAGRYFLAGRDISALSSNERAFVRNRSIGFVFQNFNLLPRLSALENVALPLMYRGREAREPHRSGQKHTLWESSKEALRQVGLEQRAHHWPTELSGGERQRVAIARALVVDPDLILADEPTGSLDSATGAEVMGLLDGLWRQGRTLILVTHDAQVAAYAQRVLYMKDGAISRDAILDAARDKSALKKDSSHRNKEEYCDDQKYPDHSPAGDYQ